MHGMKLSPTTSSSLQRERERERERDRERERERERDREHERDRERGGGDHPSQLSPNGTEGSSGAHDLLMDSPSE